MEERKKKSFIQSEPHNGLTSVQTWKVCTWSNLIEGLILCVQIWKEWKYVKKDWTSNGGAKQTHLLVRKPEQVYLYYHILLQENHVFTSRVCRIFTDSVRFNFFGPFQGRKMAGTELTRSFLYLFFYRLFPFALLQHSSSSPIPAFMFQNNIINTKRKNTRKYQHSQRKAGCARVGRHPEVRYNTENKPITVFKCKKYKKRISYSYYSFIHLLYMLVPELRVTRVSWSQSSQPLYVQ